MIFHESVLLHEIIDFLDPHEGKMYIDATVGGGGHTKALLAKGAKVLGIDRDPEATEYLKSQNLAKLTVVRGNFTEIVQIAKSTSFNEVDGILFDLGISSHQINSAHRGFSFARTGPLDMRMDPSLAISASDIVNNFDERRLYEIFKTYGQEKFSRSISKAICRTRQIKPIESTSNLANVIEETIPAGVRTKINKSTKVFQALRIVVNSELFNLEEALPQTVDLLKPGGRLAIVSFHSLEDAIVKRFFKRESRLRVLTLKPVGPKDQEVYENPRARSAKLRAAEKI